MEKVVAIPFTSVQAAINLFEQKIDRITHRNGGNKDDKLADCSDGFVACAEPPQPEAMERERKSLVSKLEDHHKSTDDLSTRLELCEIERDAYKEKCRKAHELFDEMNLLDAEDGHAVLRSFLCRMECLEQELLNEMIIAEYLYMELKQLKEEHFISSKPESEAQEQKLLAEDVQTQQGIEGAAVKVMPLGVTISMEEYEFLNENASEMSKMRGELEAKDGEICELNRRLEEMVARAENEEKARAAVEERLRLWRQLQRQRRAASGVRVERTKKDQEDTKMQESASIKPKSIGFPFRSKRSISMLNGGQSNYVPLGKLLNIKL